MDAARLERFSVNALTLVPTTDDTGLMKRLDETTELSVVTKKSVLTKKTE